MEFYVEYLGFVVDWSHQFDDEGPAYMQISRDQTVLHLSEHHGDSVPGLTVFIRTDDILQLHNELRRKPYRYLSPGIEETNWNSRVMDLVDPFGNHLRVAQMIEDRT